MPYVDQAFGRFMDGVFGKVDAFLLGRRTYDIFAAHWPRVTDPDNPVATKLNTLPKYVASNTLENPSWADTTVIAGDIPERVAELKSRSGRELQVHGSGALARTLIAHNLVDEYRLLTFPVVLGSGQKLFPEGTRPAALRLTDRRVTSTGVGIDVYEPAGEPTFGSFELD